MGAASSSAGTALQRVSARTARVGEPLVEVEVEVVADVLGSMMQEDERGVGRWMVMINE
jgi:hypothetical protein